jgi:uncharacterized membrane protein YbhN (UPF0104 family)
MVVVTIVSRRWVIPRLANLRRQLEARSATVARIVNVPAFLHGHIRGLAKMLVNLLLLSALIMAINLGQIYTLSQAVRMSVGFPDLAFAYAIASLVVLLPISIGGLGTREATYVVLLGSAGATQEATVTFSLLDGQVLPLIALAVLYGLIYTYVICLNRRSV